jgi:hypothetical protein
MDAVRVGGMELEGEELGIDGGYGGYIRNYGLFIIELKLLLWME